MDFINEYVKNIVPYNVTSHKIWQVSEEEKNKIIKLDWNEAVIQPSPLVNKKLEKLLQTNFLNLYPSTDNQEIYTKLSEYVKLPKTNIQYFASSDYLQEYIVDMYVKTGDSVLVVWPNYDNFRCTAQIRGANVIHYDIDDDFKFDADAFEKVIENNKPSFVYISNPNNPIGYSLPKTYIQKLLDTYRDTMFLIDEAYIEFSSKESSSELVKNYENILITRTLSKAFALANIRFGYILASNENIQWLSKIRNSKNISTFSQEAAIAALSDVTYMKEYVREVIKARDDFINNINNIDTNIFEAYDSDANFVLIRCKNINIKEGLLNHLISHNVYVRNLIQSKSLQNCVRVTIGLSTQMNYVADLFKQYNEILIQNKK